MRDHDRRFREWRDRGREHARKQRADAETIAVVQEHTGRPVPRRALWDEEDLMEMMTASQVPIPPLYGLSPTQLWEHPDPRVKRAARAVMASPGARDDAWWRSWVDRIDGVTPMPAGEGWVAELPRYSVEAHVATYVQREFPDLPPGDPTKPPPRPVALDAVGRPAPPPRIGMTPTRLVALAAWIAWAIWMVNRGWEILFDFGRWFWGS